MQKKITLCLIVALVGLMLCSNVCSAFGFTPVKHVAAGITFNYNHYYDGDSITNVPVTMNPAWFLYLNNAHDGQGSVFNPKIYARTSLNIRQFYPNDPQVFTANPPNYNWNFAGLEVTEGAGISLGMQPEQDNITASPNFTLTRTVTPEILTEQTTLQTITVSFKLEEQLPAPLDGILIYIGSPVIAYLETPLVQGRYISQNDVSGWTSMGYGTEAGWHTAVSNLEIGKTYTFQAVIEATKSEQLQGSPVFTPGVRVQCTHAYGTPKAPFFGTSTTVTTPDNSLAATFSVSGSVSWGTLYTDIEYNFGLKGRTSDITQPPFHVIAPATVDFKPDSYNLKKQSGEATVYIQLPDGYSVENIDTSTVKLNGALSCLPKPTAIGDYNEDGIPDLMVKFNLPTTTQQLPDKFTDVTLTVSGYLTDGTFFTGVDTIKVISN